MDTEHNNAPQHNEDEMVTPAQPVSDFDEQQHNRVGLVLMLLIVLLMVVLGGLYLWYETAYQTTVPAPTPVERTVPAMPNEPEMPNADASVQQLNTVSTSNELSAIEADIESTNLEELDAELQAIEAELDAAF